MKFVRCKELNSGEIVYINLDIVKAIYREEIEERAAMLETIDGKMYECYHDVICNPQVEICIREF